MRRAYVVRTNLPPGAENEVEESRSPERDRKCIGISRARARTQ